MTIPVYPTLVSDDPNIESWKEGVLEDPTIRSPRNTGIGVTAQRYTRVQKKWDFNYDLLSDADKQLLERFEKDEAHFGVVSFYWPSFKEAYGCDPWVAGMTPEVGQIIQPVEPNGRSYRCTVKGETDDSEPTWPTTVNGVVVDGAATWRENSYRVKFASPIQFEGGPRIDFWRVAVSLAEV